MHIVTSIRNVNSVVGEDHLEFVGRGETCGLCKERSDEQYVISYCTMLYKEGAHIYVF